eukprot:maker-scaffold_9-snap-gene-8.61-mRNA-1 protein AED:0.29 eAED:0.29 QI:74/1/1/1/0.5/0.33/3/131/264
MSKHRHVMLREQTKKVEPAKNRNPDLENKDVEIQDQDMSHILHSTKAANSTTGKWIKMKNENGWEYVERTRKTQGEDDAVVIIPEITLHDSVSNKTWKEIILVQQERPPLKKTVLEFPAGLCDDKDYDIYHTAARELLEETGYLVNGYEVDNSNKPFPRAKYPEGYHFQGMFCLGRQCPSSAGLTNETYTLMKVELEESYEGSLVNSRGAVANRKLVNAQQFENIVVQPVKKEGLYDTLMSDAFSNVLIDSKVLLYAAALKRPN